MYDDAALTTMAADLESDLVERKESLSADAKDKISAAICAFSNDLPGHRRAGVVFVGLKDDSTPAGLRIDDRLLLELGDIRSAGNILPLPVMTVTKWQFRGVDVAVIVVEPAPDPPILYKGRICIRVGPRQAIASRDEERILTERRRSLDLPFDQRPVRGASLDDLDLDRVRLEYLPRAVAPEILAENHRSIQHQLAALHLATPDGLPTVAALLLFGREPHHWIPGAYVQFVRFNGVDVTDPVQHREELVGPLAHVVRRMDDLILAYIRVATEIGTHTVERRQPDYAVAALQQILRNAVMHRTYEVSNAPVQWYWFSDRVEVHSPGGPYGRVTAEYFGAPGFTSYRNPTLSAGMMVLGFVQRFGMGLPEAKRACAAIHAAPPEFQFRGQSILAVLRSAAHLGAALVLDPRGVLSPQDLAPHESLRRVPVAGSLDLELRLRALPVDRGVWRIAMAQVEVAVHELAQESRGTLHIYSAAPYPLAAWLGSCLDRYARALPVVLHQLVPGSNRWIPLLTDAEAVATRPSFFEALERVADHGSGKAILFIVEGARAQVLTEIIPQTGDVRWVYRLRPRSGATLDTEAAGACALAELRAAVERLRRDHSNANYHIVPSGPVALVVELARLLPATAVGSAIFYSYDATTGKHYPVLDISPPKLV